MNINRFLRRASKSIRTNIVSILGLGIAMTLSLYTITYTVFELSYDHYHKDSDLTYIIKSHIKFESGRQVQSYHTSHELKNYIDNRLSQIEISCRTREETNKLNYGELYTGDVEAVYSDEEVFDIFSLKSIHGSFDKISDPGNAIITRSLSEKLFGKDYSPGEILEYNDDMYRVAAVIEDPPENTNLKFDMLLPLRNYLNKHKDAVNFIPVKTYVRFHNGPENLSGYEEKITGFYRETGNTATSCKLSSLHGLHQEIHNTKRTFLLLITTSVLVLVIACINYINMLSAYYNMKTKEMGIRKSFGCSKADINKNILIDSFISTMTACITGMLILGLTMDIFASLTGINANMNSPGTMLIYFLIAALVIIISISTGLLAAKRYHKMAITDMLSNGNRIPGNLVLRKFLLFIQFTISTGMIIIFFIFIKQLNYISDFDPGFETDNKMLVPLSRELAFKYDSYREELYRVPGVVSVTGKFSPFGSDYGADISLEENSKDQLISATGYCVQDNFFETYGINIIDGNSFTEVPGKDSSLIIIDEYTAGLLNLDNPVGKHIKDDFIWGTIIGVAENTSMVPLRGERKPVVFNQIKDICTELTLAYEGEAGNIASMVEDKLKKFDNEHKFSYTTIKYATKEIYQKERHTSKLIMWWGIIAVILSLSGAYALTSFITSRSLRQISIRKILGANTKSLIFSSLINISRLVIFAGAVAYPVCCIIGMEWLKGYSVKVETGPGPYILSTLSILLIVLMVVYAKIHKAVNTNPFDVLRAE